MDYAEFPLPIPTSVGPILAGMLVASFVLFAGYYYWLKIHSKRTVKKVKEEKKYFSPQADHLKKVNSKKNGEKTDFNVLKDLEEIQDYRKPNPSPKPVEPEEEDEDYWHIPRGHESMKREDERKLYGPKADLIREINNMKFSEGIDGIAERAVAQAFIDGELNVTIEPISTEIDLLGKKVKVTLSKKDEKSEEKFEEDFEEIEDEELEDDEDFDEDEEIRPLVFPPEELEAE